MTTHVELLAPGALLAAPLALVPAAAVLLRARRHRETSRMLGLAEPPLLPALVVAAGAALAVLLLFVAAAQPALARSRPLDVRTDAELYVVLDTSRSMAAQRSPSAPTRLARAKRFAVALRADVPQIPTGVASFTDRVLPHVLPTSDESAFDTTLADAIGVDRPPPLIPDVERATWYALLSQLPAGHAFSPNAHRRLIVLLTDGESRGYRPSAITEALARRQTRLLLVRFWSPAERVFLHGRDVGYRPTPDSTEPLDRLGALSVGGRVFGAADVLATAAAARRFFGSGPTVTVFMAKGTTPLAPWVALAALAPLLLVTLRRGGGARRTARSGEKRLQPLRLLGDLALRRT